MGSGDVAEVSWGFEYHEYENLESSSYMQVIVVLASKEGQNVGKMGAWVLHQTTRCVEYGVAQELLLGSEENNWSS